MEKLSNIPFRMQKKTKKFFKTQADKLSISIPQREITVICCRPAKSRQQ
jgi:hypothetical protein